MAFQLTAEVRDRILAGVPDAIAAVERAIAWYKSDMLRWEEEASTFGNFRSAFMGLVDRQGNVDHYGGWLRVVDADGHLLADKVDPKTFNDYIGEAVEPWSYLKSTYWKPMGYPDGLYRVGPLARLNVAERTGTPRADEELEKFRWRVGRIASSSFHYHYARLIDTLHAIEKIEELLRGPDILSHHVRSVAGINRSEGIGVSEAPRGTLMHHYKVDDNGLVRVGQPGDRHRSQQHGDEPGGPAGGPPPREGGPPRGGDAQPGRGGHPLLRPVPVLLHARPRPDGDQGPAARPGRASSWTSWPGDHGRHRRRAGHRLRQRAAVRRRRGPGGGGAPGRRPAPGRAAAADVRAVHQLTPELALDVSRVSLLVLVDASADAPAGEVVVTRLDPAAVAEEAGGAMTHHLDPAGIVGLARELWGVAPPVVVVSVGIASLEAGERLTPAVEAAVPRAVDAVAAIIEEHARA